MKAPPPDMIRDPVSLSWYAGSKSGPSTVYRVAPDGRACSCPHAFFRGAQCKHRLAVLDVLSERQQAAQRA